MRLPRRALLTGISSLALSGCSTAGRQSSTTTKPPDSDGDGVPDHGDDYPNDDRRAVRKSRISGSPTLQPGEYSGIALTNSPQAQGDILHYQVSVAGETGVDCLVFDRENWDAYADGARDVDVVTEYSRTNVTDVSVTLRLDRGEYLFAIDYTSLLTDPCQDSVEVSHVVEIAEPPPS